MADAKRLAKYFEVSLVEQFAIRFHLDIDVAYTKEFNLLLLFTGGLWSERDKYQQRYRALEKIFYGKQ